MAVELLPHQTKAVEELRNGNVLKGGVGSGKTPTSLAYYWTKILGGELNNWGSVSTPTDLYIFTTARKRGSQDWQDWGSRFGLTAGDPTLSVLGINFVVDSYNNMAKYKGVKNAFLILDEQRMVGSGLWSKTFLLMAKSNRWIMLSATPADKWEDYIPLFIANGFYKNRTEFARDHLVYSYYGSFPRLERYLGTAKLARLRKSILVEMPFERHTVRHLNYIPVDYDRTAFERVVKDRWNIYKERPLRDVAELFATMRKVVNSDGSRLAELRSLMRKHPKLIVFYNFDYELEILRQLADSPTSRGSAGSRAGTTSTSRSTSRKNSTSNSSPGKRTGSTAFEIAEYNGHKHEPLPTSDRWVYLVQYAAGAEAWNCITTDAVAFYSLTYSYKQFEQCQGRIDRLDTPFTNLHYYILVSKSIIDKMILAKQKDKKSFNEADALKEMGLKK